MGAVLVETAILVEYGARLTRRESQWFWQLIDFQPKQRDLGSEFQAARF